MNKISKNLIKKLYRRGLRQAKFFDKEKDSRLLLHNYYVEPKSSKYEHLEIEKDDEFQLYFFSDNEQSNVVSSLASLASSIASGAVDSSNDIGSAFTDEYKNRLEIGGQRYNFLAKLSKEIFQPINLNNPTSNNKEKIINNPYVNYYYPNSILYTPSSNRFYRDLLKKFFSIKIADVDENISYKFGKEFFNYLDEIIRLYLKIDKERKLEEENFNKICQSLDTNSNTNTSNLPINSNNKEDVYDFTSFSNDIEFKNFLETHFLNDFTFKLSEDDFNKKFINDNNENLNDKTLNIKDYHQYKSKILKKILSKYLKLSSPSLKSYPFSYHNEKLTVQNYITNNFLSNSNTPNFFFLSHPFLTSPTSSKAILLLLNHGLTTGSYGITVNKKTNFFLNDVVLGLNKDIFSPFYNSLPNKVFLGGEKRRLQIIQPYEECLGYQSFYLNHEKEKERESNDIKRDIERRESTSDSDADSKSSSYSSNNTSFLPIPSTPIVNPDINLIKQFVSSLPSTNSSSTLNPLDAFRFYVGANYWAGYNLQSECARGFWFPINIPPEVVLGVIDLIGAVKFDQYNQPYAPKKKSNGEEGVEIYILYKILEKNANLLLADDLYYEMFRLLGKDFEGYANLPSHLNYENIPKMPSEHDDFSEEEFELLN